MNLIQKVRTAPKRFVVLAALLVAGAATAATFAWGPSRQTFTYEKPADFVTFNSITNNPRVGDERNFVRIKEDNETSTFGDNVTLEPGKVYQVMVYYHNNAADNLNASGKGIAKDVTLKMEVPGVVKAGVNAAFTGTISSSNAKPGSVWDEAYGKNATSGDIVLRYVTNSAVVTSNGAVNGKTLPDTLFTTGTNLGYDSLNGTLPGCNKYAGYVTFKIRVDQPNFTIQKQISKDNKTWAESIKAAPGDTIYYRIVYQNTGSTQQDNVILRDTLPVGISYIPSSSEIANSTTKGQYEKAADGITTNGYNAGSYQPKGNVYFRFSAKIADSTKLACGTSILKNIARATTSGGYKEDDAIVTVEKKCEEKTIEVCRLSDKKYPVTIKESEFDSSKYSKDPNDCKEEPKDDKVKVCRLQDKEIVWIKESEFNESQYSKDFNDCKEEPVVPETPEEIPSTGPAALFSGLLGSSALGYGVYNYAASRRALKNALK